MILPTNEHFYVNGERRVYSHENLYIHKLNTAFLCTMLSCWMHPYLISSTSLSNYHVDRIFDLKKHSSPRYGSDIPPFPFPKLYSIMYGCLFWRKTQVTLFTLVNSIVSIEVCINISSYLPCKKPSLPCVNTTVRVTRCFESLVNTKIKLYSS